MQSCEEDFRSDIPGFKNRIALLLYAELAGVIVELLEADGVKVLP